MLVVGPGGGGGGSSNDGVSNGGGGGGITLGVNQGINITKNNIVSFVAGTGGIRGNGNTSGQSGASSIFKNETLGTLIEAKSGFGGNKTSRGGGATTSSVTGYTITSIYNGGNGGDKAPGSNWALSTNSKALSIPTEILNVLSSHGIPSSFGGGGGGSKEDGDDWTYTGGKGAISGVGGARGVKSSGSIASEGTSGIYGGGGGAGGYNADGIGGGEQERVGGNGGDGLIVLWVDKKNVS